MVPAKRFQDALVVDTVRSLAEPVVREFGLELVEVQYRREARGRVLRLVIDRDTGVTIDDCARVSREVGHLLEVEDPIERSYVLEVSSPGLDRPLKREADFLRCRGRKAKVITREPVGGRNDFVGLIGEMREGKLALETGQGTVIIPAELIAKAKLVVDF